MGIKRKVFICDCCGDIIDGRRVFFEKDTFTGSYIKDTFYKIPGFKIYLEDSCYRGDDLIICRECLQSIQEEIKNRNTVNFDIEIK